MKNIVRQQFNIALSEETHKHYKELPTAEKGHFLTVGVEMSKVLGADICEMIIKANSNGWSLNEETLFEIFKQSRSDYKKDATPSEASTEKERIIESVTETEASVNKVKKKPKISQ